MATYRWNEEQTDGVLKLDGDTVPMAWTDEQGHPLSTNYRVPHEGECVTCHQKNGKSVFIGPTIASLNRSVLRDGEFRSQLEYLESEGVVESRVWESAPATANYKDPEVSPEDRGEPISQQLRPLPQPRRVGGARRRGNGLSLGTPEPDRIRKIDGNPAATGVRPDALPGDHPSSHGGGGRDGELPEFALKTRLTDGSGATWRGTPGPPVQRPPYPAR